MGKYRAIYTAFWEDSTVVEEMAPEGRYFYLYLLTNPKTTQIGIYEITKKRMAFELGYAMDAVNTLLKRFVEHFKVIRYNEETTELAIKNWGRYNLKRAGKPMMDCVKKELQSVKDLSLIAYVGERIHHETMKELYESILDENEEEAAISEHENAEVSKQESEIVKPKVVKMTKKDKNDHIVEQLFHHYLSKNIIHHKRITPAMRRAVNARLRNYTVEELMQVIDNYAFVYFSDRHWFTHKYPFADLMREKDVRKFLDEADPIENYAYKRLPSIYSNKVRKEDFDLS